jgi:pilus assembly protein Flp/PilA
MELVLRISRFLKRTDRGATAIEYALIAAGIALVIVAATSAVGTSLNGLFGQVSDGFGS